MIILDQIGTVWLFYTSLDMFFDDSPYNLFESGQFFRSRVTVYSVWFWKLKTNSFVGPKNTKVPISFHSIILSDHESQLKIYLVSAMICVQWWVFQKDVMCSYKGVARARRKPSSPLLIGGEDVHALWLQQVGTWLLVEVLELLSCQIDSLLWHLLPRSLLRKFGSIALWDGGLIHLPLLL